MRSLFFQLEPEHDILSVNGKNYSGEDAVSQNVPNNFSICFTSDSYVEHGVGPRINYDVIFLYLLSTITNLLFV